MKELQYINFPVSFLRKRDLKSVLEQALQFCSYETMVLNKYDKSYFNSLVEKLGLSEVDFEYDLYASSKRLYEENVKSIRCGVNIDVFRNYLRTSKDDLNIEFRAYCSTKAILGKKVYKKTRFKEIFSLMFGYISIDDISPESRLLLSKYESTRSMKRTLDKLEEKWHLSVYSLHSRGMYISYKLSPVDLIVEVEKMKIIHKNRQRINEQRANVIISDFINELDVSSA